MNEIFFPLSATWFQIERWADQRGWRNWSVCPSWQYGVVIQVVRYDLPV